MSECIYSQNEIFDAVLPLLKKYRAEKAILLDLMPGRRPTPPLTST